MSEPSLESLDGVGEKRAELLRRHGYTSVESLAKVDPKELVGIQGIGPATATDLLASVVRVLDDADTAVRTSDASDPVMTTPRFGTPFSAVDRVARSPAWRRSKPGAGAAADSTAESDRSEAPDVGIAPGRRKTRSDDAPTHESGGDVAATVALAHELLSREADGTGRIGRTPIDTSNVDANITLRFTRASRFDADPAAVLANARLPKRTLDSLPEFEDRVLDRLATDSGFAADLVASPETAIRSLDADDPISELFALPPASPGRCAGRTLAPVGLASLRIETDDASSAGGD
ncbi:MULTISPECIES: helix-hairpin-helix domain-containing protein [Haloferacaceae]|uniref:Helix-hairpin-helix domain-containing protein n=1 Tax=Halorubrum glutamatedens TaxID=2707018 RepID=A0ABD5QW43_9EURY|nr:helix-hairpin-helix domain-containing protein [Halobellus captivus]